MFSHNMTSRSRVSRSGGGNYQRYFSASTLSHFICTEGEEHSSISSHFCVDWSFVWSLSNSWGYQSSHFSLFIHYLNSQLSSSLVNNSGRSWTMVQFTSLHRLFIMELGLMDIGQWVTILIHRTLSFLEFNLYSCIYLCPVPDVFFAFPCYLSLILTSFCFLYITVGLYPLPQKIHLYSHSWFEYNSRDLESMTIPWENDFKESLWKWTNQLINQLMYYWLSCDKTPRAKQWKGERMCFGIQLQRDVVHHAREGTARQGQRGTDGRSKKLAHQEIPHPESRGWRGSRARVSLYISYKASHPALRTHLLLRASTSWRLHSLSQQPHHLQNNCSSVRAQRGTFYIQIAVSSNYILVSVGMDPRS